MYYFKIISQAAGNYRGPAKHQGLASILQKDCGLDSGASTYSFAAWVRCHCHMKEVGHFKNAAIWQPLSLLLKWQSNTKTQRGKWDLMTSPCPGQSKSCQITAGLAWLHRVKEGGPSSHLERTCSPKRLKYFKMFSPTTTIQSLKTWSMFMTDEPHQVKN